MGLLLAGGYFVKVHCFCFEQQVLAPGERVMMPVSFYVDPSIMDDPEGRLHEAAPFLCPPQENPQTI